MQNQRDQIVALAAQHRLPAAYPFRGFVAAGGLISFGNDQADRIGWRPAMLIASSRAKSRPTCRCRRRPIRTVINLKTAKALGLTIPETLLATADEVIQ